MSIELKIGQITSDRNAIRAKLVELGLVGSAAKLSAIAAAIEDIVNRGAVSATVQEGDTYTIPAGYHNGSGTVSGVGGGGSYNLQSKTATPTKKQQNITPDSGYYGMSDVTVAAIPDNYQDVSPTTAAKGDVLTGKVFVSADGTVTAGEMAENGAVSATLDVTVIEYTIPAGHHSGGGKVRIVTEQKTATPSKTQQTITPASGKVLSQVTMEPIPAEYITTEDANAAAGQILAGASAYVKGAKVEGSMADNGDVSEEIDGLSVTSVTIPAGYTSGGTVSLTDDIEKALAEI